MTKARYSIIKYHEYRIEGIGKEYALYHPDGFVGTFPTASAAKAYVDKERKEADDRWNAAVMEDDWVPDISAEDYAEWSGKGWLY